MRGRARRLDPDHGAGLRAGATGGHLAEFRPDLVHVMYYNHEQLTLLVREFVGDSLPIVFECRDPLTALNRAIPGTITGPSSAKRSLPEIAISSSARPSAPTTSPRTTSISPELADHPVRFPGGTVAPPSPKLSAVDGRIHIALVGTAGETRPQPLVWHYHPPPGDLGFVVHSHFWDLRSSVCRSGHMLLARSSTITTITPPSGPSGTELSKVISRYDLMGVFHELGADTRNESAILAVCLPTKAVCGWLHGAIPVVCFPHYRGVVERIEEFGIGFVVDSWEELGGVGADRGAIAAATPLPSVPLEFTTERSAERIAAFVAPLLAGAQR